MILVLTDKLKVNSKCNAFNSDFIMYQYSNSVIRGPAFPILSGIISVGIKQSPKGETVVTVVVSRLLCKRTCKVLR